MRLSFQEAAVCHVSKIINKSISSDCKKIHKNVRIKIGRKVEKKNPKAFTYVGFIKREEVLVSLLAKFNMPQELGIHILPLKKFIRILL